VTHRHAATMPLIAAASTNGIVLGCMDDSLSPTLGSYILGMAAARAKHQQSLIWLGARGGFGFGFGQERGSPDPLKADTGDVPGAGRRPALPGDSALNAL